jgi:hypothetical protein
MATTQKQTLTIANGQTTSDLCNAATASAFGLVLPAAFTGTSITYTVSADGSTFQALYDNTGANQVTTAVTQGRSYDLPAELTAWPYFKLVSGSAEGAARSLVVVGKRS